MKLQFMLLAAVALSLILASPAAASHVLPFTVVDRTAISLVYAPEGPAPAGGSLFTASVSYRFGPTWDLLVSSASDSDDGGNAFRVGARFHTRAPARGVDPFVTLQYASESGGVTAFLVGGGVSAQLAPRIDGFAVITYHSEAQVLLYDLGLQYQVSPQFSVVGGINSGLGYIALAMSLGR